MQIRLPQYILLVGLFFIGAILALNALGCVVPENLKYIRILTLTLFVTTTAIIGYRHFIQSINKTTTTTKSTLKLLSIILLLLSTLVNENIGFYIILTTFFFAIATNFQKEKKSLFTHTNILLLLYALMHVLGTIGTTNGFHVPKISILLLVIPISFNALHTSESNLLKIAHFIFKCCIIFTTCCLIFWFFNFLYLDIQLTQWISSKNSFWIEGINLEFMSNTANAAYHFVNSWIYYYHPTFTSFTLVSVLILGFHLLNKNTTTQTITKAELLLYGILSGFTIILMESRVGSVSFALVSVISTLFYLKNNSLYFKHVLIATIITSAIFLILYYQNIISFTSDEIRDYYIMLAKSYVKEHIWWGAGFNQQSMALEHQAHILKESLQEQFLPICYTHNQFLGNMVQYGLWGPIALVTLLISITINALQTKNFILMLFITVTILFLWIEEPLTRLDGTIRFVVFLSFILQLHNSEKQIKTT